MRILFVEDPPDDAEVTQAALRHAGLTFQSHVVATRHDLIEALDRGPWTAIIAGSKSSGFCGTEALRIVRDHDADVPFILLDDRRIALDAHQNQLHQILMNLRLNGFLPPAVETDDTLSFPEAAGEMANVEDTANAGEERAASVLLVEDDEAVAIGIGALLSLEGMNVDVVTTGAEAIEYLRTKTPDVVILDVSLPDMDGTKVYEHIAQTQPELPVIFSTEHADRARLDELSPDRPVLYLLKPFEIEVLLETIDSALRA